MQVPVRRNPQTRVSEQQAGYAHAVQPLEMQIEEPIAKLAKTYSDHIQEGQLARQEVDLNHRLLQEVNGLQADFAQRQTDPNVSPVDFAANMNRDYTDRHAAIINDLRQQHYNSDLIDSFDARLGAVRQGFFERALVHQATQLDARAANELESTARDASQYAATDPVHNYATSRDTYMQSVRTHPDLTEARRDQVGREGTAIIRDGAMRSLALQNPQLVIDTLDPHGLTAPFPLTTTVSPEGASTAQTEVPPVANTGQRYVNGWAPRQRNGGDNTDQQVDNYIGTVSRSLGVSPDTRLTEANLPQMAQVMARVESGGAPSARSVRNNNPGNIQNGSFARSQPGYVGGDGRFARFDSPQAGQNAQVALLRRYLGRGQVTVRSIIEGVPAHQAAPQTEVARAEAPITGGSQLTDGPTIQNVDIPASTSDQQQAGPTNVNTPVVAPQHDISAIHTGNALIDDLDGRERMQLLGLAREQLTRTTAMARAQMDVTIHNITSEAMNNGGEIATPIPSEQDVLRVYGPVEGPQHWSEIQQSRNVGQAITTFRTQSPTEIQAGLDRIRPQPGSPTYATQEQIYEHAQQAAQTLLQQREHDPAGYVMQYFPDVRAAVQQGTAQYYAALDRAYQSLGIDPATAPVMTTEASRQLAEQYRTMSPDQRRQFMVQNWSMGEDRFRRFVHGMEGTPAEADARIFALLRSYPMAAGPSSIIFQDVMIGRDAIAQDPARRPRAEDVTREFRNQGLNAIRDLNAEASRAIEDAAEGLYVQRGGNNRDGTLNTALYRESLRTVLGGNLPAAMGHGQAGQYYTILPPGVNEDQFRGWIERQTLYSLSTAAAIGHGPRAPLYGDLRTPAQIEDIINDGTFVMTSPGHYMVRMASDGRPLMTVNGQPFIVNVDRHAVMSATPYRLRVPGHPLGSAIHGAGVVQ